MAATLETIQTKIRRLTRSPSTAQITDAQLNEYINTFVLYDIPEHLRLFSLHTTLTFYTQPYVDTYKTNTVLATDPMYNFKDKYTTVNPPMYVAGYYMAFSQSQDEFRASYPIINSVQSIGTTGNGVIINYDGTLSGKPILQSEVLFTSIDSDNNAITLKDIPRESVATGLPTQIGDLVTPDTAFSRGTINYVTGAYDLTFPTPPANGAAIYSQTVPYQPSRPSMVLYYDNAFIVRPVPDKAYKVTVEAYMRPTALIAGADPEMEQWHQYISYGAAKKVLEDRMDMESVQMIMPEFKEQECLVLRRTLAQQANNRTQTIYSGNSDYMGGGWNRNGTFY